MPHMQALTQDGITADLGAVVAHLAGLGFDAARRGIVGFCMGGLGGARRRRPSARSAPRSPTTAGGVTKGRFGFPPARRARPDADVPVARLLRRPRQGDPRRRGRGAPRGRARRARSPRSSATRRRPRVQLRRPPRGLQPRGREPTPGRGCSRSSAPTSPGLTDGATGARDHGRTRASIEWRRPRRTADASRRPSPRGPR